MASFSSGSFGFATETGVGCKTTAAAAALQLGGLELLSTALLTLSHFQVTIKIQKGRCAELTTNQKLPIDSQLCMRPK